MNLFNKGDHLCLNNTRYLHNYTINSIELTFDNVDEPTYFNATYIDSQYKAI